MNVGVALVEALPFGRDERNRLIPSALPCQDRVRVPFRVPLEARVRFFSQPIPSKIGRWVSETPIVCSKGVF